MGGVYITGLGAVTCLGSGVDRLWHGMTTGHSAPVPAEDPHAHVAQRLLYAVPPHAFAPSSAVGTAGAATRYAIESVRQAVADAGLGDAERRAAAVVAGTGMGQAGAQEHWRLSGYPDGDGDGPQWTSTFTLGAAVSAWLGADGPNTTVSNACAAGACAISLAADMVRAGEVPVAIALGAEAYSRVALACFDRLGALDPLSCRPFTSDRQGTVFGEGAAAVVLESAEYAEARSAPRVYSRVLGAGWTCDAYHPTAPEPDGAQIARAMSEALAEAGASVGDVGVIVPHGTGTHLNDLIESNVLAEVFGEHAAGIPLYSVKALLGHTGGAAGAIAAVAAVLILHKGVVPANVALGEQDPECGVWLPSRTAPCARDLALVNAYAFGGNNISLVLRRP
ncbi:MAG TPA: beta-ketoacyl-[acyl-carrier-protein] synthase family protein [Candidatus Limnocylindrales bacterium]|nr:beta-ketoacyl-[acyl-carrier-protein] synthase family protein [Candidatus Limnocylindrales bacterium]